MGRRQARRQDDSIKRLTRFASRFWCIGTLLLVTLLLAQTGRIWAEPVQVRFKEGSVHGYLSLRSADGKLVAGGDLIQVVHGSRVSSRLTFHFRDGSLDDETAVFTQSGHFRLLTDHHIQKGPSYKGDRDVSIDMLKGRVTDRYMEDGQAKVETKYMDLPADLSNGILLNVLKNVRPDVKETKVSYLATTPKPRLVQFAVAPDGSDSFSVAGIRKKAVRFVVKVELGGLAGILAPMVGKQTADTQVWVAVNEVPAFVRSRGPLFLNGPIWTIEMTSPVWP